MGGLVILRISAAAYAEIRQRLIDGGAAELVQRHRGHPEHLIMGEIALEALPE